MLNYIWLALVLLSVVIGGVTGRLDDVTLGALKGARTAVMDIALPLVGTWAIFLGVMRLAERSGLVTVLARALRPILRFLFPDVPGDHPAMGAMVMNIAANMLGLGNAATPFGLRAMADLERLNPRPGVATNAMCTFLAINTSSVQLIPATVIGILAANGSRDPTAIVGTSLFCTSCACVAGVSAAKLLERLPMFALGPVVAEGAPSHLPEASSTPQALPESSAATTPPMVRAGPYILAVFGTLAIWLFLGALLFHPSAATASSGTWFARTLSAVSRVFLPLLLAFFPLYAALRRIKVYEEFVEGAKEGFPVAVRIIAFLTAMLAAIGMFRGSGGMEMLTQGLRYLLDPIGFPSDLLPLVLMRPLSGSGSQGLFVDIVKHFGPDSLLSRTAGTIYGSTETTFYVIAVYFGAVAIRRTRHAIAAGLFADATGVVVSVLVCRLLFGRG
jgi:spore maturation protein SpmA/spore maturation protein SpmB